MFVFLVILLFSTTQQTNGYQSNEDTTLEQPVEITHHKNNNRYNHERIDEYTSWEDYEDGKEGRFGNGEAKSAEYQVNSGERDSRRLFDWLSRLFRPTTPKAIPTTVTTTESSYERDLKDRIFLRALHHNLTDVLFKLSEVEKQVSFAMEQKEANGILTKGKPKVFSLDGAFYYRDRVKRDVSNVDKAETETKIPVTEKSADNNTSTDVISVNTTECPCDNNVTSGRRAGSFVPTPTELKNKLLLYLQESFQEIKGKITSLKDLKQAFSDNVIFKIGYILANIDTLEISMLNLKSNMDKNKEYWEDNKILELYDTLKVSNQAVSGLIESLKVYLEKLSYQPQANELNLGQI